MPFAKGLLEPYADVEYLSPAGFTPEAVRDADALVVRTRTRCDERLLGQSRCSLVATATIGTDHIDLPWCASRNIEVANAAGCNAPAVAQYVFSSLMTLVHRPLWQHTIGIVGVGHVGSIVERWARQMDMRVLLCDPPRQQREGGDQWHSLQELAEACDIITFHTPLDATTRHMADDAFFAGLRRAPVIINAARGPVVDTEALIRALDDGKVSHAVIDCWEGEPSISRELLERCAIATPHIAGYSYEGKVRGTRMAMDAVCRHFGLPEVRMGQTVPAGAAERVKPWMMLPSYDPMEDTRRLKEHPESFEALRNHYDLRHEVGV